MAKAKLVTGKPLYLIASMYANDEIKGIAGVYTTAAKAAAAIKKFAYTDVTAQELREVIEEEDYWESAERYGRYFRVEHLYKDLWY